MLMRVELKLVGKEVGFKFGWGQELVILPFKMKESLTILCVINATTTLVCEPRSVSLWALSLNISKYLTTIEGVYNIDTYNIGV